MLGVCVVGRGVVVVVESREAGRWEVGTGTAISGAYICGGLVGVTGRAAVDLGAYHWRSRGKVWNEESGYFDVVMLRLCAAMSKILCQCNINARNQQEDSFRAKNLFTEP